MHIKITYLLTAPEPARGADGHVSTSPGRDPTGPCRMCWHSRWQRDKALDGSRGEAPSVHQTMLSKLCSRFMFQLIKYDHSQHVSNRILEI